MSGAVSVPSATGVVLDGHAVERPGTASAVFNTFRQIGCAVAIAAVGVPVTGPDYWRRRADHFAIAGVLLLVTAVLSLRILHPAR